MTVWLESGASPSLLSLFNQSSRFRFELTQYETEADLAIVDWRCFNTRAEIPLSIHATLPSLAVAADRTSLFVELESSSSLDCCLLEIVGENEFGSELLDARILKLMRSHRRLLTEKLVSDNAQVILETVMRHSNDWMVVKSLDNRFLQVSKKFCHAHSLPPEEIIGKNDLEIGLSPELVLGKPGTDWKGYWALDKEVTDSGEHSVLQPVVLDEDASEETRESTDKVPLRDSNGDVFALFVCVSELRRQKVFTNADSDIVRAKHESVRFWETKKNLERSPALTELDNARQQAEAQQHESERAFIAKNQFIASASHDLRQPLHALGLYLRALEEKVDENSLYLVERLKHCVGSLNDLLTSLLDISKLDANVVSAQMSSFSSDELLNSLREECQSIARGKSLEITCASDGSQVYSDPVLLRRVFRNLLTNAINYTDEGKISLTAVRVGSHVNIVVADTGVGIPQEKQHLVFEEFAKFESRSRQTADTQQGLGLGLSIVKRLCGLLDIQIELQSVVDKGTRVSTMVPLGQSVPIEDAIGVHSADSVQAVDTARDRGRRNSNNKLILVVDDERKVCDAVETILVHSGYRVVSAVSVEEALELLQTKALIPDAALVDFRLSEDMTGLDALQIFEDILGVSTPALVVTGDTTGDGLKEITDSGYQHLHKPVDVDELLAVVREMVH